MVMKMFKRLTAFFISMVLLLEVTPAFAEYYVPRDLPSVTLSDLEYKSVSIKKMDAYLEKIRILADSRGKDREISALLYNCFEIYYNTDYAYSVANLTADRLYNEKTTKNLDESTKTTIEAYNKMNEAIEIVYNSDYKSLLADFFGDDMVELYIENMPTQRAIELTTKELELVNSYTEIFGDSRACAELFVELANLRNELANEFGYDNYAEYANEAIYGRDFSDSELSEFYNGVAEYIVPIQYDFYLPIMFIKEKDVPMTDDDILLNTRNIMGNINPELRGSFDYMISNNLYDVFASENKSESSLGYTINLPYLNVPFLFINPDKDYNNDGVELMKTLIHEFGHFSAMLYDPALSNPYHELSYLCSVETCEVQSQGLEALSEKYYGRLFGSAAPYERYSQACSLLASVVDGCLFNEWQTDVYKSEEITVDVVNELASKAIYKYYDIDLHPEDAMEVWTAVVHNFSHPMYYISYAVSAMAALDLYNISVKDYNDAVDRYMTISSCGSYMPFRYLIDLGIIGNVFDKEEIHRISEDLMRNYALNYEDVVESEWYTPYLYEVSNIFFGRAENTFMPHNDITRSEFIGAIGRMYDYYVGIEKEYPQPFPDVGDGDENSRYIAWAEAEGIVSGYDNGYFGGNDTLSREQAATIIYRLEKANAGITDNANVVFSDFESVSDWAKEPVLWATEQNIIDGRDNNKFVPKSNITRAETAKIIACYINSEY